MKNFLHFLSVLSFVLLLNVPLSVSAQCLTASNGQYPSTTQTISACNGTFTVFATDCWNGEYTKVNVTAGNTYTFQSSVTTDFITISNKNGTTSYASGVGSVTLTAPITTIVRFYTHANASCGEDNVNKKRKASCTMPSACSAPSAIVASAITNTTATISWTAASPAPTSGYQYEIRTSGTGGSGATGLAKSGSTAAGVTTVNITGLTAGTTYKAYIRSNCGTSQSTYTAGSNFTTTGTAPNLVPQFSHIVVVIGENTNASAVFGSANAPYINALAAVGAKFTNSYALFHPSQPNYLGLYSGSNQGVTNDNTITTKYTTANLGKELINAGKTYKTYSEGLPSVGYDGSSSGNYVRKHNPAANWMGTGTNQIPTSTNQPFTAFPTNFNNLPSVAFVIPDLCNDGHDVCPPINNKTRQYDSWIETNLDAYKQWCINNNSLLIVTYDEDDFTATNKISTVFYGANVITGVYNQTINHYNVLRTLEDANSTSTHAGAAATATPINFCWTTTAKTTLAANTPNTETPITIYPNPITGDVLNISVVPNNTPYKIINMLGKEITIGTIQNNTVSIADLPVGVYFLEINLGNKKINKKFVKL